MYRCIKCSFKTPVKLVAVYHIFAKHKLQKMPADHDEQTISLIAIDE